MYKKFFTVLCVGLSISIFSAERSNERTDDQIQLNKKPLDFKPSLIYAYITKGFMVEKHDRVSFPFYDENYTKVKIVHKMSDLAEKVKKICEKAARFQQIPDLSRRAIYKVIDDFNNDRDVCRSIEEAEKLSLEMLETKAFPMLFKFVQQQLGDFIRCMKDGTVEANAKQYFKQPCDYVERQYCRIINGRNLYRKALLEANTRDFKYSLTSDEYRFLFVAQKFEYDKNYFEKGDYFRTAHGFCSIQ